MAKESHRQHRSDKKKPMLTLKEKRARKHDKKSSKVEHHFDEQAVDLL